MKAQPLTEECAKDIEAGKADPKERAKLLKDKHDTDKDRAECKSWCWGPETEGANIAADVASGVQDINEIKEHGNSAFQWATKEGPLCQENMRSIRFHIHDVTLLADSIYRGAGQIMTPTRRCHFACIMTRKPARQEPGLSQSKSLARRKPRAASTRL
jgi:elongation factor 2